MYINNIYYHYYTEMQSSTQRVPGQHFDELLVVNDPVLADVNLGQKILCLLLGELVT